ncbi:hypothetical protein PHMEG_00015634 [Phytophthora megakarya]|uniref:Peptidase A2 domain-containing protein n=1 Tax=Phytophthora megakarya TaxID=4795 RepID=A0A225W1T6_9STRA|nr:hypothetical protein PHMEG_00015634 [Phytophthora megakarya]
MNVFNEDLLAEVSFSDDSQSQLSDGLDITTRPEFRLKRAVNNLPTDILLDSGASVSMVSLSLARRLKLKLKFGK